MLDDARTLHASVAGYGWTESCACTALCGFSAKVRETTPDEMRQILASSASSSIRSNGKHELAVPDALEGVVQEIYCMQPQCL